MRKCPVCSQEDYTLSNILLPEGFSLECKFCKQYFSQTTLDWYCESMKEFARIPKGTAPNANNQKRSSVLHKRRLNNIQRYLGKPPQEIHLLDVGASSGLFLSSAQALGFKAEGVEPSEGCRDGHVF